MYYMILYLRLSALCPRASFPLRAHPNVRRRPQPCSDILHTPFLQHHIIIPKHHLIPLTSNPLLHPRRFLRRNNFQLIL